MNDRAESLADQVTQLRRELSLAEEGLANYQLEVERLRTEILEARRNGSIPEAFWLDTHTTAEQPK